MCPDFCSSFFFTSQDSADSDAQAVSELCFRARGCFYVYVGGVRTRDDFFFPEALAG